MDKIGVVTVTYNSAVIQTHTMELHKKLDETDEELLLVNTKRLARYNGWRISLYEIRRRC